MKKSALLAVSALSLGVVGLATFTPMVNAADTKFTGDATVSVQVKGTLGMGGTTGEEGGSTTVNMHKYDVAFDPISAGSVATAKTVNVETQNNTGHNGSLTIKAATNYAEGGFGVLKSGENKITSSTQTPAASVSTWGYSLDSGATYKAVTDSEVELNSDAGNGTASTPVMFNVSADENQAAGNYSGDVTYTYTVSEQ